MNNKINTSKGKMYLTVVAMASLLVMAFNVNTNSMNVNAIDFGLISKDFNVGSIDNDSLFNCVGAAITCDNDNTVNNNIAINNGNQGPLTCVECFENANLSPEQTEGILNGIGNSSSFEEVCDLMMPLKWSEDNIMDFFILHGLSEPQAQALIDCLVEAGIDIT